MHINLFFITCESWRWLRALAEFLYGCIFKYPAQNPLERDRATSVKVDSVSPTGCIQGKKNSYFTMYYNIG